jgi:ArsR family metal-binding transcriptional regulator
MIMHVKTVSCEQNNNRTSVEEADSQQVRTQLLSALENCAITIVEGGGCACQGNLKRAVVDLPFDISGGMQYMSTLIEGCAYNPTINRMAFCMGGMNVIVEPYKIVIHKAQDEVAAMTIVEWLKDILKRA